MTDYKPMTQLPESGGYKAGDVLVLVGELFGRGYANGLVEEAKRVGMTVIGTTVGRRDSDGSLRPLNAEELAEAESILGGTVINVPLEAGFDMEAVDGQPSVAELLKKLYPYIKLKNLSSLIKSQRTIKKDCEIQAMKTAQKITRQGIISMMKASKPGMYEYQLKAEFDVFIEKLNNVKSLEDMIFDSKSEWVNAGCPVSTFAEEQYSDRNY